MSKSKLFVSLIVIGILLNGLLFAQKCMFLSITPDPGNPAELPLIEKLGAWGYDVTVIGVEAVKADTSFDYSVYDFLFLSESTMSKELPPSLKGHPIPLFTTEGWATRERALCWSAPRHSIKDNPLESVLIVDTTGHQLAGGFGGVIDLAYFSDNPEGGIISCVPTIEFISIAALSSDLERHVILAVEAGTELADGTIAENRAACIGIHEVAYQYLTDEAYTLIKAAIEWVLGVESSVAAQSNITPVSFNLSQNYPNPFNPTTDITFSISRSGHTNLTVYNALGQAVQTIIDKDMTVGTHQLTFEANNIPSGIYFYKLQSGDQVQVRKMVLMQ